MAPLIAARTSGAGLGTRIARGAVVLVWAGGVIEAVLRGGIPSMPSLLVQVSALLAALAAALLVTEQSTTLLAPGSAAVVVVLSTGAAVAGVLVRGGCDEVWLVQFAAFIAALLIARGNVVPGVTAAAFLLLAAIVPGGCGAEPAAFVVPVVAVVSGILWRLALRRIVAEESAHRGAAARARLETAASAAAAEQYRGQLERVRREAAPALRRLAEGGALDEDELADLRAVEGALRDRMRAPWLDHPRLSDAAARARRRGVRVSLLWDQPATGTVGPALCDAVAALFDAACDGSVVVRAPAGSGVVSVMRTSGAGTSRVELDAEGAVVAVR